MTGTGTPPAHARLPFTLATCMCMYNTPTYMQFRHSFWNTYTYAHAGSLRQPGPGSVMDRPCPATRSVHTASRRAGVRCHLCAGYRPTTPGLEGLPVARGVGRRLQKDPPGKRPGPGEPDGPGQAGAGYSQPTVILSLDEIVIQPDLRVEGQPLHVFITCIDVITHSRWGQNI